MPPHHGLDAEHQLADAERLDDVVVRAELEADDAVDLLPLRGDHHDRDVLRRLVALERLADLEPGDVRQHEVEQHDVRELVPRELEPAQPGLRDAHVMPRLREVVTKHLAQVELVVDHEDTCHES